MTDPPFKSASSTSTDRWDNEGGSTPRRRSSVSALQTEFERHGIVPVQLTVFDWGGYRYTNASDAIAAAKRATTA
jgi:hypothetical protein